MFHEAEALARRAGDKRADEAAQQAKRMEPSLSRMVLDVAAPNQAAGVEIRRDGTVIDPAAWTSAIPIDPGAHTIEATGKGLQAWQTTVTIEAKPGTTTVQVPALVRAPDAGPTAVPQPYWGAQRIAGVSLAGAGLAGVVVGSILGGLALKRAGDLKNGGHCSADLSVCDATGLPLRQGGQRMAHGSTAALVVGAAALGAGVVVFAIAPSGSATAAPKSAVRVIVGPVASAEMAGMLVRGGW